MTVAEKPRRKTSPPIDKLTGLPVLTGLYSRVRTELKKREEAGFLFFDVVQFRTLQGKYGKSTCNELLRSLGETLRQQRGRLFRDEDLVAVGAPGADYFVIFLFSPPRRKEKFSTYDLKLISYRVLQKLSNVAKEEAARLGIQDVIDFHSGYTVIQHDAKTRTERLIHEAQKEAALKSQLETVMIQFISNVSHELRTPLTCIRGFTETLLEGGLSDPELARRWLQIINDEAQRLENLIKDLLDISMIEARQVQMRFKKTDIMKMAGDIAAVLEPYAQKSEVKLELDVHNKDIPQVVADEDRLRQVIINLVDNAIKYSPQRSSVRIQLSKNDRDVMLSVIDKGAGIPESELENIFERFYRVEKGRSSKYSGRGLGLAIAKHIVEAHGGFIRVTSQVGKGSNFTINLPLEDISGLLEHDLDE
ncbi:MAG: ATP-binding protein [Candidatus Xenobia bacterium]